MLEIIELQKNSYESVSFLQSDFWASFKQNHGWTKLRYAVNAPNIDTEVSILFRKIGKGFLSFTIAYFPLFPHFQKSDSEEHIESINEYSDFFINFAKKIKEKLPKNTLCLKFDPYMDFFTTDDRDFFVNSLKNLAFFKHLPIKKSKVDIQPPDTTILDLTLPIDRLLELMKPKWRYNIRLAEKKGVSVKKISFNESNFDFYFEQFYELFITTSKRDGIAIHSKQYYKDLFELSYREKNSLPVKLYIAEHEKNCLAGIIVLFSKFQSVYLYGASGNNKRNLMPSYLLQWSAICDAKEIGSLSYDFYGIPPTDDERHAMHGLYRFKTGFGGKIIHRPGTIDIPLNPLYGLYTFAENLRAIWYKKIVKKLIGR